MHHSLHSSSDISAAKGLCLRSRSSSFGFCGCSIGSITKGVMVMERGKGQRREGEIQIGFILMAFVQTCMCAAVCIPPFAWVFSSWAEKMAPSSFPAAAACDYAITLSLSSCAHGLRHISKFSGEICQGSFQELLLAPTG